MKKKLIVKILVILVVISANIGCDQAAKHYAKKHLADRGTVRVLGDFFILHYAENNGAFLSMFSSFPRAARLVLLLALPSVVVVWMTVWLLRNELPRVYVICLSCFIGGSVSNLYDRFTNNEFVIDFMNLGIGSLRTGIFNPADLSIMLGAAALMIYSFRMSKTQKA